MTVVAVRVFVFLPPEPHVFVQAPNALYAETTQSMGQAKVLQTVSCIKTGHSRPPFSAAAMMERVLVLLPEPHDTLHAE
jgi:hypothetical protein